MTGKFLKRKLNKFKKWILNRPYEIRRSLDKRRVKNKDFTIISNNCWAGKAYQYLDLPYLTPTVGLYFFAEDYLKFIKNLYYYISIDLEFIKASDSKYFSVLKEKNQAHVPIGKLDDIEIIFLHYSNETIAKEKWEYRKKRINFDNIFLKFSNMNLCTEDMLEEFDSLVFDNKFMLNNRKKTVYKSEVYWNGLSNEREILNDTNPYPGILDVSKLINKKANRYPLEGLKLKGE